MLAAGIRTFAVTDHDTVAAVDAVRSAAEAARLTCVAGIEITAVEAGRDVHILGYFVDPSDPALGQFLTAQRLDRRRRVSEILERLRSAGVSLDADRLRAELVRRGAPAHIADRLVRVYGSTASAVWSLAEDDAEQALSHFERVQLASPRYPGLPNELGRLIDPAVRGGAGALAHRFALVPVVAEVYAPDKGPPSRDLARQWAAECGGLGLFGQGGRRHQPVADEESEGLDRDPDIAFKAFHLACDPVEAPRQGRAATQVFFGATVTYANGRGEERTITIVGVDEVALDKGHVSWISPIAKALLKAEEGDVVKMRTPQGVEEIEIVSVTYA